MTVCKAARAGFGLLLLGPLAGCQAGDEKGVDAGGYPSLHAVPDQPRPSLTVDERRRIVRGLIDERDRNRQDTMVVRGRSGLATIAPDDLAASEAAAEDVVPEGSDGEGSAFRLKSGSKVPPDSVYRGDARFEDGSLDDFIRQLKRDTRPSVPAPVDQPAAEPSDTDDVSNILDPAFLELAADRPPIAAGDGRRGLLPAFAPAVYRLAPGEEPLAILLAASDEEPGPLCRYFGWAVGWSTMCLDDTEEAARDDGDEPVGADLEQELRDSDDGDAPGRAAAPPASDDAPGREGVGRRLSEEDAAEAIEDAGRSVLAPVTNSLDRLRDYLEERRAREPASPASPSDAAPSGRPATPSARAMAPDRPPIPESRPERREDITLVDQGETFDFVRTPRPAFKPSRDLPVILPPAAEPRAAPRAEIRPGPPPEPVARPGDLLTDRAPGAAPSPAADASDASNPDLTHRRLALAADSDLDAAATSPEPAASAEAESTIIQFEPEKPGLPEGASAELMALLVDAKARGQKIHIIGEASSNHVARRRATDVGALLVQLGATVEILEYDHQAIAGADRVRLVLMPDESLSQALSVSPTLIEE